MKLVDSAFNKRNPFPNSGFQNSRIKKIPKDYE